MSSRLRIIVTGLIAQHPTLGGVSWDYLQYPLGLARLGHDVYYFEDTGQWPCNLDGGPTGSDWIAYDPTANVKQLATVMNRYGLGDRWAYHFPIRSRWYGLPARQRREVIESADLLINVSGTLKRPHDYRAVPRLVYIDSDPVFTQAKLKLTRGHLKFQKRLAAHDVYFSFGERFSSRMPATGHRWRPTRQPIVLSEWRPNRPHRDVFTTVMSWTSYRPLAHQRQTYGQKDMEFKRFIELPQRVQPIVLEVALGKVQHSDWERNGDGLAPAVRELLRDKSLGTRDLLRRMGWRIVDAAAVGGDLDRYRHYIESSKAEWSVAKNGYVVGQPGWFSCRSACYLAAGRPAVVQDTGFSRVLPVGEGILTFRTLDHAAAAIGDADRRYEHHAAAARQIAEEYFDSDKVLAALLNEAMSYRPRLRKLEALA